MGWSVLVREMLMLAVARLFSSPLAALGWKKKRRALSVKPMAAQYVDREGRASVIATFHGGYIPCHQKEKRPPWPQQLLIPC